MPRLRRTQRGEEGGGAGKGGRSSGGELRSSHAAEGKNGAARGPQSRPGCRGAEKERERSSASWRCVGGSVEKAVESKNEVAIFHPRCGLVRWFVRRRQGTLGGGHGGGPPELRSWWRQRAPRRICGRCVIGGGSARRRRRWHMCDTHNRHHRGSHHWQRAHLLPTRCTLRQRTRRQRGGWHACAEEKSGARGRQRMRRPPWRPPPPPPLR